MQIIGRDPAIARMLRCSVDTAQIRKGWIVADALRVDPSRLTAAREAYDKALDELEPQLDILLDAGFIRTPWLGDEVSNAVVAHYNRTVMESDLGTFQAMQRYGAELKAIRDQFARMEQAYLATETANTSLTRRVE